MSNSSILLIEDEALFSPISQLNYSFYDDVKKLKASLLGFHDIQCIVGMEGTPFGQAQQPRIEDYADGIDTLAFLDRL